MGAMLAAMVLRPAWYISHRAGLQLLLRILRCVQQAAINEKRFGLNQFSDFPLPSLVSAQPACVNDVAFG